MNSRWSATMWQKLKPTAWLPRWLGQGELMMRAAHQQYICYCHGCSAALVMPRPAQSLRHCTYAGTTPPPESRAKLQPAEPVRSAAWLWNMTVWLAQPLHAATSFPHCYVSSQPSPCLRPQHPACRLGKRKARDADDAPAEQTQQENKRAAVDASPAASGSHVTASGRPHRPTPLHRDRCRGRACQYSGMHMHILHLS